MNLAFKIGIHLFPVLWTLSFRHMCVVRTSAFIEPVTAIRIQCPLRRELLGILHIDLSQDGRAWRL
jgi:hypothetical protein